MIYFDITKAGRAGHRSGLTRVSTRLRTELGGAATEVVWNDGFRPTASATRVTFSPQDWLLTPELFSAEERPGFADWLDAKPVRRAAIFHDAIPLKHPHITWPQSVARHPGYLKGLARFDRIWAVSEASRQELIDFWRWQGAVSFPAVDVLPLGADFHSHPRITSRPATESKNPRRQAPPQLLSVGILEPRKNQLFLLGVCEQLWREGLVFELHLVGRVNPHFGAPIVTQIKTLRKKFPTFLRYHEAASDTVLSDLFARAHATVFPTLAEGCGLPLLESLWRGVPCVCSDLPVLRENADAGGCATVPLHAPDEWKAALRRVLTDETWFIRLQKEAVSRPLPTWASAAKILTEALA